MNANSSLPEWLRAHGGPILSGSLRQSAEDFAVTEVLGFVPDGQGEHDFLWLEKKHANTNWVARQLAAFAGIAARDVGIAGMKDRHAVTRQWFSVRRPGGTPANWSALEVEGVSILEVSRNSRKLRRGAHAGNQFRILIRDLEGSLGKLDEYAAKIHEQGVPNYFGEQRFGHDGRNLQLAEAFFAGKRLPRDKRSIALSSARAWLFNHVLQHRVGNQTWSELAQGDIAVLDGSGSIFAVEDVDASISERCKQLELHPTGPLWGKTENTRDDELCVVEQFSTLARGLEKHTNASRRALRLAVRDLQTSLDNDALTLEFFLTRGGFATAVLRELLDW
jgi:tRNA pseudouridine13 synthase